MTKAYDEELDIFSLKSRQKIILSLLLFFIILEVLAKAIIQEKEMG